MTFTIYPAIDLRGGHVVRLKEGDPARLTMYSDDPAETARRWLEAGATWLHVVNLDGAFGESDEANRSALESILKVGMHIQFGGGIRSLASVERALGLGVSRAILGTIAVEQPEVVAEAVKICGAESVAVGLGSGLNIPSTRALADASGLEVIASGGVHTLQDVVVAREANLAGVIIGRALYEGTIDLKEALKVLNHKGHDTCTARKCR
jgi:phosphoribosylformimino-5-aminoimidazole carboxamide ribotide isomerase